MTGRLAEHEIARREMQDIVKSLKSLADLETHSTRLTVDRKHLVVIPLITEDYVTTPCTRESAPDKMSFTLAGSVDDWSPTKFAPVLDDF